MATYGVIADVHGNLIALEAVLAALDRARVDRVICLGDLVGYNAESNRCVEILEARGIDCIAGNHDLIALGRLGFDRCAMRPAFALRRTRQTLSPRSRRFLAALPPLRAYEDEIVLMHGDLDDPSSYLRTPVEIAAAGARLAARLPHARLCFFGHTHDPGIYEIAADRAVARPAAPEIALDRTRLHLVNPGSVDAARRPEKLAQFACFDSARFRLSQHAIPYDHERAEASARAGGYRMNELDEAVFRARRLIVGGRRRAARLVRAAFTSLTANR